MLIVKVRHGTPLVFSTKSGEIIKIHFLEKFSGEKPIGVEAPGSVDVIRTRSPKKKK